MRGMKWHREHLPDPLPAEPLELAASWLAEATRQKVQPNPNAMVLATCDAYFSAVSLLSLVASAMIARFSAEVLTKVG